jgi:hypothetical protein
MTMIETRDALLATCDLREVEIAVEGAMAEQLGWERKKFTDEGIDPDACAMLLAAFEEWAGEYGLPTSAHVLACYLIELRECGADIAELRGIAHAYLLLHAYDVRIPVLAAIAYCEAAPRAVGALVH